MEKKQSLVMTIGAILLILLIVLLCLGDHKEDVENNEQNEEGIIENLPVLSIIRIQNMIILLWSRVQKKFMTNYLPIRKK